MKLVVPFINNVINNMFFFLNRAVARGPYHQQARNPQSSENAQSSSSSKNEEELELKL